MPQHRSPIGVAASDVEAQSPSRFAAMPTILLADPIPIVREGIRAMLEAAPGFGCLELPCLDRLAGETSRGLPTDAILLCGMSASLREVEAGLIGLRAVLPSLRILLFVDPRDPVPHPAILQRLGVADCLPRTAGREQLLSALRRIANGGTSNPPGVLSCQPPAASLASCVERLTPREREVLGWMCRGQDNAGIARGLGLTRGTVKVYVSRILGKLGAADRTQAVLIALFGKVDGTPPSTRASRKKRDG